jgi:hypothetical protein
VVKKVTNKVALVELWNVRAGGRFQWVVLGQTKHKHCPRGKTTGINKEIVEI